MRATLLSAVWPLAVLATIGGCNSGGRPAQVNLPPPPALAATPAPSPAAPEVRWPGPGPVNALGELAGAPPARVLATGNAAFEQLTAADDGYDADVALDPTGPWLVFASTRHSERADIYLQRLGGTAVVQLTADGADDVQPVFSPDGRRIAFASNRAGQWDIYLMDRDGRNVQPVTAGPGQKMHPSFSPDGTRLVYCCLSAREAQWELWVADLSTGQKRVIGPGLFPAWAPRKDVDRIAFQRARQRGSQWFGIWTLDLIDGEPRNVTEVASAANAALVCPAWNQDGTRLAFSIIVPGATPQSGRSGHDIWVCNADGSARQRVTDGSSIFATPTWGPAGRLYFISDRGGREAVWSILADPAPVAAPAHAGSPAHVPAAGPENATHAPIGATDTAEIGR
jgi:TolB protein